MAEFAVEVQRIRIEPHPEADRIELAVIGEYRSVIQKGRYRDGDLVAYIPEQSVLPDHILRELDLVGKLAGSKKNRVKATRFRGIISQGLCYPARPSWVEGQDVTVHLGITKYNPPPPPSFSSTILTGRKGAYFPERTLSFDIENYKRYPNILIEDEWVIITEKLHGTFAGYSLVNGEFGIFSKGLGARGFLMDPEADRPGVYVEIARDLGIEAGMRRAFGPEHNIFVLGEIFGLGIQDLHYGTKSKQFRVFDIRIGSNFIGPNFLKCACDAMNLEMVPVLYEGPYNLSKAIELRDGMDALSGTHMREGIVVKSTTERMDRKIGRVQLKFVSDDYLCRGGKQTEYN